MVFAHSNACMKGCHDTEKSKDRYRWGMFPQRARLPQTTALTRIFHESSALQIRGSQTSEGNRTSMNHAKHFEVYKQAVNIISKNLDMNIVITDLFVFLKDHIHLDELALIYYDVPKNRFQRLGHAVSPNKKAHLPEQLVIDNAVGYIDTVFNDAESVIVINDPALDPLATAYALHTGKSERYIGVPLVHNKDRIGGLVATRSDDIPYDKADKALFDLLKSPLALAMSNWMRHHRLVEINDQYLTQKRELANKLRGDCQHKVIGDKGGLREVMGNVQKVASLDSSIVITGETGVGKDVIANAIHNLSNRRENPFIKIDCGTIPESLIESELFGHEKGAFTGAQARKIGTFEIADKGTVFLDEIGELSLSAQVKLLRLLQHREIVRVGGPKVIPLDIRIVCATHRNLEEMVKEGSFRQDLWYRLNVFPLHIPPLRKRKQDIPDLVSYLIQKKSREMNLPGRPVPNNFDLLALSAYDWPGNIRELENVIERWMILGSGAVSFQSILNPEAHTAPCPETLSAPSRLAVAGFESITAPDQIMTLNQLNKEYIEAALKICNHQVGGEGGAAARLGLPRTTLASKMKKLGIASCRAHKAPPPMR
ncbi:rna polymerase sigma factor 54 interaction domain [Desulfoluna spongiiphila]|nr:rna polymerase sigma factor 54 interaction domain [Desulfoluna spongiiphila]